jgi:hypothetical protein
MYKGWKGKRIKVDQYRASIEIMESSPKEKLGGRMKEEAINRSHTI